jgi:ribonuclease D
MSPTSASQGGRFGRPRRYQHRSNADAEAHALSSLAADTPQHRHPLATVDKPQLITREGELSELLANLRAAGSFAFDSEFIGELTYEPKLCLIQAASATRVALIDPLADLDVKPFWELVADPSVEKVVHAGQQDVEPVFRALGRGPANLFDTQISAGFIGLCYPLSLMKLVDSMVGARLNKGLTFTHWDRRPLSDHQLRYAADDVRYLPALRHEIGSKLAEFGHSEFAREESESLADASLYEFDPDNQWQKIRGATQIPPRNQAVLRELMIWRNTAAKQENVPPRTLVKDDILLDMARCPAEQVEALDKVRGLPRPVEMQFGEVIVAATRRALALPESELPVVKLREPNPREKFQADSLWFAAQCLCTGNQIDPSLVTSRGEIGDFYRMYLDGQDSGSLRLMRGWRRKVLGDPLVEMLKGKLTFSCGWEKDFLRACARSSV